MASAKPLCPTCGHRMVMDAMGNMWCQRCRVQAAAQAISNALASSGIAGATGGLVSDPPTVIDVSPSAPSPAPTCATCFHWKGGPSMARARCSHPANQIGDSAFVPEYWQTCRLHRTTLEGR